jgi:predicted ArsR family transcriptional regulator
MEEGPSLDKIHHALGAEPRATIVEELRREPKGLDVQVLARRLGLHANTVRWHLGVLADAGIVTSHAAERTTPGRPRIVYKLGDDTATGGESYRLLATILAGVLGELEDGQAAAEEAGRTWGRYLVESPPPPNASLSDTEATGRVVELLAGQGFRPEVVDGDVHMHHCPYRELAPGIVCRVHRGLIGGALEALRAGVAIEALDPFVEPDLCVGRLRPHRAD